MEDYEQLCMIHNEYEPFEKGVDYRACGECCHVFETANELIWENNRMLNFIRIPHDENPDPETIVVCPLCTHDF